MRYVYPVLSRRAGGVSVGINLNPNNACNWRCIYCQVPDLKRGGPPPIELDRLASELDQMLGMIVAGDFMADRVPAAQRRLVDIAFSGNGEPTSAAEFPDAVTTVAELMARHALDTSVKLRLITNGSLLDKAYVRDGIRRLGEANGEVWFKVDTVTPAGLTRINGTRTTPDAVLRRLKTCAALCPTWVQTCLFALDGCPPAEGDIEALTTFLAGCRPFVRGVHLYGLARPSALPEAYRLSKVSADWMEAVASRLKEKGLVVTTSP